MENYNRYRIVELQGLQVLLTRYEETDGEGGVRYFIGLRFFVTEGDITEEVDLYVEKDFADQRDSLFTSMDVGDVLYLIEPYL